MTDPGGNVLWTTKRSIFARGEGGFGGERGPSTSVDRPDRAPDVEIDVLVLPQQALLYRMCGDRNPLHPIPDSPLPQGFPGRYCTALCTYGMTCKAPRRRPARRGRGGRRLYGARFAGVLFPARPCGSAHGATVTVTSAS